MTAELDKKRISEPYVGQQQRLIPAERAERVGHAVAAFQQSVQTLRLLFQEFHRLHLHPQHHPHLTLQAGELVCATGGKQVRQQRGTETAAAGPNYQSGMNHQDWCPLHHPHR